MTLSRARIGGFLLATALAFILAAFGLLLTLPSIFSADALASWPAMWARALVFFSFFLMVFGIELVAEGETTTRKRKIPRPAGRDPR